MIVRHQDWANRLTFCLADAASREFCWGSFDCALFAADCVQAMTGADPAASWRGSYTDVAGAARMIHAAGGLAALVDQVLPRRISPLFARRGDIVMVHRDGADSLSVCIGQWLMVPTMPMGLTRVRITEGKCAWRI